MKQVFSILLVLTSLSLAAPALNPVPYTSRAEYKLGTHVNAGGSTGVIGMSADWHFLKNFALLLKAGTGIYFNAGAFEGRYFLFESSFSPYIALGGARWGQTGSPAKLKENFSKAVELGLVNSDGTSRSSHIYLTTTSLGLHYLSEYGFSVAFEGTALFSLKTKEVVPWFGLSLGWYF